MAYYKLMQKPKKPFQANLMKPMNTTLLDCTFLVYATIQSFCLAADLFAKTDNIEN